VGVGGLGRTLGLAVDGASAKRPFPQPVLARGLVVVSWLCQDAHPMPLLPVRRQASQLGPGQHCETLWKVQGDRKNGPEKRRYARTRIRPPATDSWLQPREACALPPFLRAVLGFLEKHAPCQHFFAAAVFYRRTRSPLL
jgi:hypothetical protein